MSPSGIDDFPNVGEADIRAALPFLKKAGATFYVHAELVHDVPDSEVRVMVTASGLVSLAEEKLWISNCTTFNLQSMW